jgi:serine/threonine protein kinase
MIVETPSDREYACFFCGKGKSKTLMALCPQCGKSLDVSRLFEGGKIADYKLSRYINRGFYGATYYSENRIGKPFAVKIIPRLLYAEYEKSFEEEILKYRQLGSHPNIAELIDAGESELKSNGSIMPIFFIVTEWIEGGQNLSSFIDRSEFSISEMYGAILDIASGVSRFENKNLWHNDLNGDNILVKALSDEELETRKSESRYICKIIDTGSAVFRQSERHKALDDVKFLGVHINAMRQTLLRRPSSYAKEDLFFIDELAKIVARMLDEDPGRAVYTVKTALEEVKALYKRRHNLEREERIELTDPFAYSNANEFPSPIEAYINLLFSNQFPWLAAIISPETQPMLITGPRGSGKTMILQSMRLKTKLSKQSVDETSEQIKQRLSLEKMVGFFVSARIDIGNHCPLTKLPRWANNEEQVNLYFNLLYAYEIINAIVVGMTKSLIDVTDEAERTICEVICDTMQNGIVGSFSGLLSSISVTQNQILRGVYERSISPSIIGPTFLTSVCQQLRNQIPFFTNKNIVFLLDDFSLPKVPMEIQRTLLSIIWNPGGGYSFRVTSHSESMVAQDLKGIMYIPNREYTEINLGASYVSKMDEENKLEQIRNCVDDIFKKRFALNPTYRGKSLEELLGREKGVPIGRRIQELKRDGKLQTLRYSGWDTIIKLCSGDISYIIDVLRRILAENPSRFPVRVEIQNRAIRRYARSELYRLQEYIVTTCNLYEVAANFGKFSRFKLEHEEVGAEKRPAEYLRIEVEIDGLSATAKEAIADLLRNGVFIDGGFSSSGKGLPARRLIFKKLFTPVFPTTYSNRDTWPMSATHFSEFIGDPKKYLKRIMGEDGVPHNKQAEELDNLLWPLQ